MATPPAREPHYTKLSEWVSECGANGMEAAVYQHLAKRINHSSGSRMVDPSRARLAADVGLKKPDDVDPYLRALAVLGPVVIHAKKGMRTKYELPLYPPEGYDGPENTHAADKWQKDDPAGYKAWRARRRALVDAAEAPYAEKKRARVAKSRARRELAAEGNVPVATGRSEDGDVPVPTGRYQPVGTGNHRPVATGTNQDDPNDQTNSGDGRRPSAVSKGSGEGGSAASGKKNTPSPKAPPADVSAVLQAIPASLRELLERDCPGGLPRHITENIGKALVGEQRTVDELITRMHRRWARFGYEDDALSAEGSGIRRPVGVLDELLSASKCWGNNPNCEDGIDRYTDQECPRCLESVEDHRAARAKDAGEKDPVHERARERQASTERPSMPTQRPAAEPGTFTPEAPAQAVAAMRAGLRERRGGAR